MRVSIFTILYFFILFQLHSQTLHGVWMTKKIELIDQESSMCAHGRGIIEINQDSTFNFYRSGWSKISGNLNLKVKDQSMVISSLDTLLVLEWTNKTRKEILTLRKVNDSDSFDLMQILGDRELDTNNSDFLEWEYMSIKSSLIDIRSNEVDLQTTTNLITSSSGSFLTLAFEYDGFMIQVVKIDSKRFVGYLYNSEPSSGVVYADEECKIEPILQKIVFKRL